MIGKNDRKKEIRLSADFVFHIIRAVEILEVTREKERSLASAFVLAMAFQIGDPLSPQ
jgi:hypothetical protein